ncbi:MAG TPA: hypothetical protein DHU72_00015 [Rikenellaceae bacterium]|nr:hypothetical protein [Rikenellaceae bacterium]
MGQRIRLKICGKGYELVADTPEMERVMRLAAEEVESMLVDYNARFPETGMEDKIMMIAVRECAGKFYVKQQLGSLQGDVDSLDGQLKTYLKGTKEK